MRRVLDRFYAALMAGAAVALLSAFISVMLGIADRQFAFGLRGLDAYAGYAIASALFLSLPATLQRGEHIRVSLLTQRLGPKARAVLVWWSLIAGVLLSAYLAFYAVHLVWVSHLTHDVSPSSDATPLWLPQIGMALGCIGLAVAMADALVSRAVGSHFDRAPAAAALHAE